MNNVNAMALVSLGKSNIPKSFLTKIAIPDGPLKGELADPCMCGYRVDFDSDERIYLIRWNDGDLMFCHEGCVGSPDA